jgi:hypothetical protein
MAFFHSIKIYFCNCHIFVNNGSYGLKIKKFLIIYLDIDILSLYIISNVIKKELNNSVFFHFVKNKHVS